jgi:hypothetical protein
VEEEGNRKNTTTSPEKTSEEMTEPAANIESFEGNIKFCLIINDKSNYLNEIIEKI